MFQDQFGITHFRLIDRWFTPEIRRSIFEKNIAFRHCNRKLLGEDIIDF